MRGSKPAPSRTKTLRRDGLHLSPSFRAFWLSRTISNLGSAASVVALPILAYQVSGSPLVVGLVAASNTLPYVFFGLVAGAVADRFSRRKLMVISDVTCAVSLGSLGVAALSSASSTLQLVICAFASSSAAIFFESAVYGLVPAIVGKERIVEANSSLYSSSTVVRILGSALAGLLISTAGIAFAILLDATTFALSALFISSIRTPVVSRKADALAGFWRSIADGLGFLWREKMVRVMTVIGTLLSISGGAVVGQLVIYATTSLNLASSDWRTAILYTAWSAGGVGGALILKRVLHVASAQTVLVAVLPAATCLAAVVIFTSWWTVAIFSLFAWGTGYTMLLVNTQNYAQGVTPSHLQGRVNTTRRMLSSGLGVPLGALIGSLTTTILGVHAGMSVALVSTALATSVAWISRVKPSAATRPGSPSEG